MEESTGILPSNNSQVALDTYPDSYHRNQLTNTQRKFLTALREPFIFTNSKEEPLKINRIIDIARALNLNIIIPYQWVFHNRNFKIVYQRLIALRERVYNDYAKESLMSNVIAKKEISLIFYLKNRCSDEYKDDSVLNQIFLKQNSLNLNLIQTTVNNYNVNQLVDKAKELSTKLEKLNTSKDNTQCVK